MPESEISKSERHELVGDILTALDLVPEKSLVSIMDALEKNEVLDSLKIKKLTGLSGQNLESLLMLFRNSKVSKKEILVALETAIAVSQNIKKNQEHIDLSWTGPIQFSVDGRTTPSVLEEMIQNAKSSIIITGYSITEEAQKLIKLLERAVDKIEIILVVHSDEENKNLETLSKIWTNEKKPKVYSRKPSSSDVYFKIHAKMAVVDRKDLLVTSANLTWHGMSNNFEIGLRVRGATAKKAEDLIRDLISRKYLKEETI